MNSNEEFSELWLLSDLEDMMYDFDQLKESELFQQIRMLEDLATLWEEEDVSVSPLSGPFPLHCVLM